MELTILVPIGSRCPSGWAPEWAPHQVSDTGQPAHTHDMRITVVLDTPYRLRVMVEAHGYERDGHPAPGGTAHALKTYGLTVCEEVRRGCRLSDQAAGMAARAAVRVAAHVEAECLPGALPLFRAMHRAVLDGFGCDEVSA